MKILLLILVVVTDLLLCIYFYFEYLEIMYLFRSDEDVSDNRKYFDQWYTMYFTIDGFQNFNGLYKRFFI